MMPVMRSFMKRLAPLLLGAFVVLLPAGTGSGQAPERFELAQKPRPGDHYNFKVYSRYQINARTQEGEVRMSLTYGYGLDYQVLEMDKRRNITNRITIHSMLMRVSGPFGTTVDFDSTDPFQEPALENSILASLMGFTLDVKINPSGRVVHVKGFEELIKEIGKLLPDSPDKRSTLKNLRSQLDYKTMMGATDQLALYPKQPVAVGDSWQGINQFNSNGLDLISEDRYEIKGRKDGVVFIDLASQIKPRTNSGPKAMNVTGSQRGVIEVLEENGWVHRLRLEQEITGTAKPEPGSDQSFQMSVAGTVIIEPF